MSKWQVDVATEVLWKVALGCAASGGVFGLLWVAFAMLWGRKPISYFLCGATFVSVLFVLCVAVSVGIMRGRAPHD